ncbi:MAG: hypothetical protein H7144_04320 [Burkholderiales bacterium]|nr:hypothetical protein [Phycisphaerae bacterium]
MSKPDTRQSPNRWLGPAVAIALVGAVIFLLCGGSTIVVIAWALTDIPMVCAWLIAGAGYGQLVVRPRDTLLGWVTKASVGIGAMGLLFHVMGLAGLLGRISVITIVAGGMVIAIVKFFLCHGLPARDAVSKHGLEARATGHTWIAWLVLSLPLGIAIVCASIAPGLLWNPLDPHPYDVMSYHLQVPREWYDAGRIIPLTHNAFSFFPMLMETHYLAAMHVMGGPWRGMYVCQFVSVAHGALAVLAVAGVLLEMKVSRATAWSGAVMTAGVPWTLMLSTVCYVESGVMLYTALAAGWAIIAMRDGKGFWLAGACAGLACGMKYTVLAMTLAPICGALLSIGLIRRQKSWMRGAVQIGIVAIVIAAPWFIRNAVWTGNPVFPLMTGAFDRAHFTEAQVDRYAAAHRPPAAEAGAGQRLSAGWSRTIADPQFGYLLLPVTAIAGALMIKRRDPGAAALIGIIAMMAGVWLFATHVAPRFITPLIPLAAILICLAAMHAPRAGRIAVIAVAALQLSIGMKWLLRELQGPLEFAKFGLFHADYLSLGEPPDITQARAAGQTVALIGESQAFYYVLPSRQLIYRSVFDVNIPPGVSTEDGWLGESVESLRARGIHVVINRDELERLSRTYRHLGQNR